MPEEKEKNAFALARFQREHEQRIRLARLLHPPTQKDIEYAKVRDLMQLGALVKMIAMQL